MTYTHRLANFLREIKFAKPLSMIDSHGLKAAQVRKITRSGKKIILLERSIFYPDKEPTIIIWKYMDEKGKIGELDEDWIVENSFELEEA
jgi:hypothetical protein